MRSKRIPYTHPCPCNLGGAFKECCGFMTWLWERSVRDQREEVPQRTERRRHRSHLHVRLRQSVHATSLPCPTCHGVVEVRIDQICPTHLKVELRCRRGDWSEEVHDELGRMLSRPLITEVD